MWIFPLGLQLTANAIIAAIIKNTSGFHADFAVWELVLFFAARPRLSWIVLGAFSVISSGSSSHTKGRYFPWWSSFMSQFIAEFILQLIALYIMGRTAHFATGRGYYLVHTDLYRSLPPGAHMMYSGALYYLIIGSFSWLLAIGLIIVAAGRFNIKNPKVGTAYVMFAITLSLTSVWLASWIFWVGFVRLAGPLYCPPKLIHQGVIWGTFSLLGTILGGGGGA
ncbi:hypothetical protein GJ744_000805 [Endocarpon pusillum]|uniref:Uncharacterized protein n=1 Tax=Endocarpon pusillum TaxID=364733 RepID=A0A8H7E6T1_9EURO|nr:hypothetical protein GJ744_000805 [Endocarpon pusillum]